MLWKIDENFAILSLFQVAVLKKMRHPNIVSYQESFEGKLVR